MEALLRKRGGSYAKINTLETDINQLDENAIDFDEIELQLESLTDNYKVLEDLHNNILIKCKADDIIAHQDSFNEYEKKYKTIRLKLTKILKAKPSSSNQTAGSSTTDVRLPKIDLPTYNGDINEWLSFHDLFVSSIHNNTKLSGAQKLQYLKSCLKGDACLLLQSFQITNENYLEAWDILVKRYQNKREIVQSHLRRLLSQPTLQLETPAGLRKLIDTSTECLRSLKILNQPTEHWDTIIVYILANKLDSETRRQWELSIKTDDIPTMACFTTFIDQRSRALSAAGSCNKFKTVPIYKQNTTKSTLVHHGSTSALSCAICSSDLCSDFRKMTVPERRETVKKRSLCYNCLSRGHTVLDCRSGHCKLCSKKHHSLLHIANTEPAPTPPQEVKATKVETPSGSHHIDTSSMHSNDSCKLTPVLLSTALVKVLDSSGEFHTLRALIDNGSMSSFITETCARKLQLNIQKINLPITGLGATSVGQATKIAKCQISSYTDNNFFMDIMALVVNKVTTILPNSKIDTTEWSHIQQLKLADPTFYEPGNIDLLLGANVCSQIMTGSKLDGPKGLPTAFETIFGWILLGEVKSKINNNISTHINTHHAQCDVNSILTKFWEIEELPSSRIHTAEEKACENHFAATHSRLEDGSYSVRLPFKSDVKDLGESRNRAVSRLQQVERRYSTQLEQRKKYNDVLQEYLDLGHMEIVPTEEIHKNNKDCYYMPHHAVIKESSTTTQLRVVFDASATTSSGISLNEKLMVGPKLQPDLVSVLLRFRTFPVALTADIAKMYRQFHVHKDDADFQRIVWRTSPEEEIKDYRLLTATFGTSSPPYMAVKCVQQLAQDEISNFPAASAVLLRDLYVDDLMTGADTKDEALHLQKQLLDIMNAGKLQLRKWSSSDPALLESLPSELKETKSALTLDTDDTIKTLGLIWNTSSDCFSFRVVLPPVRESMTKRNLLSDNGKIFDPLGFLSPVTINSKILFQELWKQKIDWDANLPEDTQQSWNKYRKELPYIETFKIQRCILFSSKLPVQLFGFCDASEQAYAAVVYARSVSKDGKVQVELVAAKTKVAPIKTLSLPRLELCGALLLSRLIPTIVNSFPENIQEIKCFSDSTVVIGWLSSSPQRWNTFVANRVSEIQDSISITQWNHVKSEDNPADCASRGISPSALRQHNLWWHGPDFLQKEELSFPDLVVDLNNLPEEKKNSIAIHISINMDSLTKYSCLSKLLRITALCLRFICNSKIKDKTQRRTGHLTCKELESALNTWIKLIQSAEFSTEIEALKTNTKLSGTSKILALTPFMDNNGILRVGGRLRHSNLPANRKFPILLPKKHKLTELLISHYHKVNLHAGTQLLLATLQQKYWIIGGQDIIRHFVRKCIICFRHRSSVSQQLMGDLPSTRVNPSRPFLNAGCDYAGPFQLRVSKGRNPKTYKAYVCLFVCFATRALHLEVVSDLTTEAFIAALKRFTSRRGKCTNIYTDCGTNFVGANAELRRFIKFTQALQHDEAMSRILAEENITWHFNPAAAPNFGGLWEAGIKSVKFHLKRVVGNASLTYEEFTTILTQIEACLNSRPLTAMSKDPGDFEALTPGHFLIGSPLTAIPEPDYTTIKENRLSRWQHTQQMSQHFWRRWSQEYLTRLQQRPKWLTKQDNLKIGQLVLLKDNRVPPMKWHLGRIMELHPGKDNIVRVITLKTVDGIYKRSVNVLCPLPLDSNTSD